MTLTIEPDADTDLRLAGLAARNGKSKAEHAAEMVKVGRSDSIYGD